MLRAIQRVTGSTRRGTEPPARGEQTRPPGWLVADPGGQDSDLDAAGQVQFAQYVGYMDFTVFSATDIRTAIWPVGQAFTDQLQGRPFTAGQLGQRMATGGAVRTRSNSTAVACGSSSDWPDLTVRTAATRSSPVMSLSTKSSTAGQHRLQYHLLIGGRR